MNRSSISEMVSLLETQRLLANRGHYLVKPKLDLLKLKNTQNRLTAKTASYQIQTKD